MPSSTTIEYVEHLGYTESDPVLDGLYLVLRQTNDPVLRSIIKDAIDEIKRLRAELENK